MEAFFSSENINIYNSAFRLVLALIAGGLIGINREKLNRAAGFRTHILICVGSCLIMIISIFIPQEFMNSRFGDPGRIASQVVTGIGFLGAGAIIKMGDNVKGLTTAASIWISAAIGLSIGAGMFWIALVAVILVLFSLIILEKLERMMFRKRVFRILVIQLKQPKINLEAVEAILKRYNVNYDIQEYRQSTYLGIVNVEININTEYNFPLEEFMNSFSEVSNLQEITLKNKS